MRRWHRRQSPSPAPVGLACALACALVAAPRPGGAQSSPEEPAPPESRALRGEEAEQPRVEEQRAMSRRQVDRRVRDYIRSGTGKITIYQVVEEMVDDFIADVSDLNQAALSPVAVRGVGLTPNLSSAFGSWVESQLITAVMTHSDVRVKRCVSCGALRTRLDGDDWVVSKGFVTQEELAREARDLGVNTYLDAHVAYVPGANIVSLNVQIFRASDGKVLWAETYRSDATTAAILRSGDRVLTRDEARAELVRKLEQRPYYGYQLLVGAAYIPYDSPTTSALGGAVIGGRIYEQFGEEKRLLYGLQATSFLNLSEQNRLIGGFFGAAFQYQLNEPNLNRPDLARRRCDRPGVCRGHRGQLVRHRGKPGRDPAVSVRGEHRRVLFLPDDVRRVRSGRPGPQGPPAAELVRRQYGMPDDEQRHTGEHRDHGLGAGGLGRSRRGCASEKAQEQKVIVVPSRRPRPLPIVGTARRRRGATSCA